MCSVRSRLCCTPSPTAYDKSGVDSKGNWLEPVYKGPLSLPGAGTQPAFVSNGGQIKCQQISGGDGYATMADGTQTYTFSFGPLSGLGKIVNGQAGTDTPPEYNPSLLLAHARQSIDRKTLYRWIARVKPTAVRLGFCGQGAWR